jgi:DNA-binding GntR family transcriptional regulator
LSEGFTYCIQNISFETVTLITRKPLRDQAYQAILDRVYRGDLPPGTRVKDTTLASQLGVSRTPVREALLQLSREGVLDADMGRGFRVCRLDPSEMREVGSILSVLEVLALKNAAEFPPVNLNRLSEIDVEIGQTRGDVHRVVDLEEEWHRSLLLGCSNRRLREILTNLWQVPRRYMRAYLRGTGRVSLSTQHHARILEALRRHDRETAAARLSLHWERGIEELGSWMAQ